MRRFLVLSTLLCSLLIGTNFTPSAEAQVSAELGTGGLDLHLFRPAVDSKGYLTVNGTDILGNGDFSFGLILDAGFGLLPFDGYIDNDSRNGGCSEDECANGYQRRNRIVDNFFTGTLHFNYGLFNSLVLGVQLPVHVVSGPSLEIPSLGGTGESIYNGEARGLDYQGLGNITIHAKYRLLRSERDPIGLAAMVHLELPTGAPESFAGETGFAVWPVLAMEWRPGQNFRLGLNVGYRLALGEGATIPYDATAVPGNTNAMGNPGNATMAIFSPANPETVTYDDVLTFGLGMSFGLGDAVDLVIDIYGNQIVSEFGGGGALSAEAMLGLKVFVQEQS